MANYIDADALMQKLSRMIDYCEKYKEVNGLTALFQVGDAIMDCPTAEVAEVRHGKWTENKTEYFLYGCSLCGYRVDNEYNFCPECGARMDGDAE